MRLFEDPRWNGFRATIAGHLAAIENADAQRWANEQLRALLNKSDWTTEDMFACRTLGAAFTEAIEPETIALALHVLPNFAGVVPKKEHERRAFDEICDMLEYVDGDALADLLEKHAFEGSEWTRESCLKRLALYRGDRAILAAVRLGDETVDTRRRSRLGSFLEYEAGQIRAKAPMRHILEAEAGQ